MNKSSQDKISFGQASETMGSPKLAMGKRKIDIANSKYPYCMVWTPLPLISWILPMIGHTGICGPDGVIHDFAGPYTISIDDMAFGEPTKYIPLELDDTNIDRYEEWIEIADEKFSRMNHNLCCNNCHSHCAYALDLMKYKGKTGWNMIDIWWMFMTKSKYVSFGRFIQCYIGFFIMLLIVLFFMFIARVA
ncbi:unnamed protein product [Moneuplotes crassus]|uniref:Transmembrane protein n=1 Tax=Euplotes crassus TaxID=5936 RepID=A0AAD2D6C6_EUPCR|nr:unnamed protein product [Moneuplotes crassus]